MLTFKQSPHTEINRGHLAVYACESLCGYAMFLGLRGQRGCGRSLVSNKGRD